jgi:hypothetical protein
MLDQLNNLGRSLSYLNAILTAESQVEAATRSSAVHFRTVGKAQDGPEFCFEESLLHTRWWHKSMVTPSPIFNLSKIPTIRSY